jgi:ubiquinone/menaquinone biosynthesis C-methylase UbiE
MKKKPPENIKNKKHWIKLGFKLFELFILKENSSDLVKLSYNNISKNYDKTWTNHMQKFSKDMIDHLDIPKNGDCLDLTCGTGYVTGILADCTTGEVTGVDISNDMIGVAKKKYGKKCNFICSDIHKYLKEQPSNSVDVVTCAWGLGYLKPYNTLKEISRILKPKGKVAIIDNSLFTVFEVVLSGLLTVAEYPDSIKHIMNVRWLLTKGALTRRMSICNLKIIQSWKGSKTYYAEDGKDAINRLIETGTAAGYDLCFNKKYHDIIKDRFGKNFRERFGEEKGIPITHRYIAAIAKRP